MRSCILTMVMLLSAPLAAHGQACFNNETTPSCAIPSPGFCPTNSFEGFVVFDAANLITMNGVNITLTDTSNSNNVISFTSCFAGNLLCGAFFMCVPDGQYTLNATRAGFEFRLKDGPMLPTVLNVPGDINDLNTIEVLSGDPCTTNADCPADGNPCTAAVCNAGDCGQVNLADDTPCDDGNVNTCDDACTAGVCGGGPCDGGGCILDCGDANPCTMAVCAGETCVNIPVNNGTPCPDGSACNGNEVCVAGTCTPGAAINCSYLDTDCLAGVCQEPGGVCGTVAVNEGDPCDDGNPCTESACDNGACAATAGAASYLVGGAAVPDCDPVNPFGGDVLGGLPIGIDCDATADSTTADCATGIYEFEVPCGNCTLSVDHPLAACNAGFDFYVGGVNQHSSSIDIVVGDADEMTNQSLNIVANFVHTDMNGDGVLAVNDELPPLAACLFNGLPLPPEFVCDCPAPGCVCRGDCNLDGFLSVVGDVPCTVERLFAVSGGDDCPPVTSADCLDAVQPMGADGPGILAGGMVIADAHRPLSSGVADVDVHVYKAADGVMVAQARTDALGVWRAQLPSDVEYIFEIEGARPQRLEVSEQKIESAQSIVWVVEESARRRAPQRDGSR